MNLDIRFSSEGVETLVCQHVVHSRCLKDLSRVASSYGEELVCPACGKPAVTQQSFISPVPAHAFEEDRITKIKPTDMLFGGVPSDHPSPSARRDLGFKLASLNLQSPLTSTATPSPASSLNGVSPLLRPVSANSDVHSSRATSTTAPTRGSYNSNDSCDSGRLGSEPGTLRPDEINRLYKSEHAQTVFCGNCSTPLRIVGRAELCGEDDTLEPSSENVYRVMVGLQVCRPPTDRGTISYRATPKDITDALQIKKEIDALEFRSTTLRSLSLGLLRFFSKVQVTSPKSIAINWICTGYLFEEYIVIVSGKNVVKAVLDVRRGIDRAYMVPDTEEPVLQIDFSENTLPSLRIKVSCDGLAYLWLAGIVDHHQQFPLRPTHEFLDDYARRVEKHQGLNSSARAPVELVLCLPYDVDYALELQQCIYETLRKLRPCDRLALVLFTQDGILRNVPLRRPDHTDWDATIDVGEISSSPVKSPENLGMESTDSTYNLNPILESAGQILKSCDAESAAMSVLLVMDGKAALTALPDEFRALDIKVHTFGLTEAHDSRPLTAIASHTGGSYAYSKTRDDLAKQVSRTAHLETQYVLQDVKMLVKPRIGSTIISARGVGVEFDPNKRGLELRMGSMRIGDTRTLVMDVKGPDPTGQALLQVLLHAANVKHGRWPLAKKGVSDEDDPVENMHCFRIESPSRSRASSAAVSAMLRVEHALYAAHSLMEEAITAMRADNMRQAYNTLSAGVQQCKERMEPAARGDSVDDTLTGESDGPEYNRLVLAVNYALLITFDKYCDAIMEKTLSAPELTLKMVHDLWLLQCRRSVARHSSLENMFLTET